MAAVARYLADTSALGRLDRPAVDAALSPLVEPATSLPAAWSSWRCCSPRAALTTTRARPERCPPLADSLIAATAERHSVTVLHYDHEYDLIASVTGQAVRWIVPRGIARGT